MGYMEIGHCLENASKTTVTLPSGEQFVATVEGKMFKSGIQLQVTQEMIDDAEAMYGGSWEALGSDCMEHYAIRFGSDGVLRVGGDFVVESSDTINYTPRYGGVMWGESAEHGTINYAARRIDHKHEWLQWMSDTTSGSAAHKSRCAYCGALTVDDSRGNCGACGGPR